VSGCRVAWIILVEAGPLSRPIHPLGIFSTAHTWCCGGSEHPRGYHILRHTWCAMAPLARGRERERARDSEGEKEREESLSLSLSLSFSLYGSSRYGRLLATIGYTSRTLQARASRCSIHLGYVLRTLKGGTGRGRAVVEAHPPVGHLLDRAHLVCDACFREGER